MRNIDVKIQRSLSTIETRRLAISSDRLERLVFGHGAPVGEDSWKSLPEDTIVRLILEAQKEGLAIETENSKIQVGKAVNIMVTGEGDSVISFGTHTRADELLEEGHKLCCELGTVHHLR